MCGLNIINKSMDTFIKDNWFKIGILMVFIIIALSIAYYFVIFIPRKEKNKIEQERQEQVSEELKEQEAKENADRAKAEAKQNLDNCISNAETAYSNNWFGECKARGLVSKKCIEIKETLFSDYLKKYDLTEEDYKQQRGITDTGALSALLDYIKRQDDCSCMLPTTIAKSLEDTMKDEKDLCLKMYPQN